MTPAMDPERYRISLKALWGIPSVLARVDLAAMLEHAQRTGSEADITLIEGLIALKAILPERP
jgi:hypothetical protein